MAFMQQARPQQARRPSTQQEQVQLSQLQRKRSLEQPQDWVLFAPDLQTGPTRGSPQTAELSRASYFGSLETGARSDNLQSDDHILLQVTGGIDDDGTELDSLDDGLRDFQPPTVPYLDQSGTVLPAHDGHGAFTTHNSAEALQERMWQHERYNPQRRHLHRRLSSVQRRLEALEEIQEASNFDIQEERRLRVEQWRTEQSKAILDEIERESRRRYRRTSRRRTLATERSQCLSSSNATSTLSVSIQGSRDLKPENESIWHRITRKVISDLMGLDDNTLSVIFGEGLADELATDPTNAYTPPHSGSVFNQDDDLADHSWEERLLDRISHELSVLVQHLSVLGTALHPSPPNIPSATPLFRPTLQSRLSQSHDASLWGIEEETGPFDPHNDHAVAAEAAAYWESDPSVLTILSYLRNRFGSSPSAVKRDGTATPTGPLPTSWATDAAAGTAVAGPLGTSPASRRRAELIRRHHPLVPRREAIDPASRMATAAAAPLDSSSTGPAKRRKAAEGLLGTALAARSRAPTAGAAIVGAGSVAGTSTEGPVVDLGALLSGRRSGSSCGVTSRSRSRRSVSAAGTGHSRKFWDWGTTSTADGLSGNGAGGSGVGGPTVGWGEV